MAALRRIAALDAADLPPMGGGKQVPTSVMLLARYGPRRWPPVRRDPAQTGPGHALVSEGHLLAALPPSGGRLGDPHLPRLRRCGSAGRSHLLHLRGEPAPARAAGRADDPANGDAGIPPPRRRHRLVAGPGRLPALRCGHPRPVDAGLPGLPPAAPPLVGPDLAGRPAAVVPDRERGRDPGESLVAAAFFQYENVSRRHATVAVSDAGEATIRDEQSTNGTFINGDRVLPGTEARLRDGDRVRLAADVTAEVSLPHQGLDPAAFSRNGHEDRS